MAEATEVPEEKQGKRKTVTWTILISSLVLMCCGLFGVFNKEELNGDAVRLGARQAAILTLQEQPNAEKAILYSADLLDAAIAARQAQPEELSALLNDGLQAYTGAGIDVSPLVELIVSQANSAFQHAAEESIYLSRLSQLAKGLRQAVSYTQK